MTGEAARLREEQERLTALIRDSYREGVKRGRDESFGSVLGIILSKMPTITAIQVFGDDLVLLATCENKVTVGTWLSVVDAGTGEAKGIVAVGLVDEESGTIHLSCVRRSVPEFWNTLRANAAVDSTPPPRLELRKPPMIEKDVIADAPEGLSSGK